MRSPMPMYESHQQTTPTRIVVAELPTIIVEAVKRMFSQRNDVVLEAEAQDYIDLLQKVQVNTNLVIIGTRSTEMPGICTHLLAEYPDLRIVALNTLTDHADIYWLGIHHRSLGKLAFETLVNDLQHGIATTY